MKKKIILSMICIVIGLLILLTVFPYINPFAPRGEITGVFIEGYHEGYGDLCGQYPESGIRLSNASYNEEHFFPRSWFYFGNQYTGIDKMIKGQQYKIWYHQESRPSDATSGDNIEYWVIDDINPCI